ncbi:MAG: aspartate aminotransferase family protein [Candidatus Rokubacteria bacterium]|nr:aspartate aminotransferase family protein [Candidatus Rokubacteria bacterium]
MVKATRFDYGRAARAISGGQLSRLGFPPDLTPVIERGEGAYVFDDAGRRYIDLVMGNGPLLVGHAHPLVVERVTEQATRGSHFSCLNPHAIELAEEVIQAVRSIELVKFASTGSEAASHVMRLARAFTGKEKILKFEGGYHGHSDYALVSQFAPRLAQYPRGVVESRGVPSGASDTVLVAPFNDAPMAARLIAEHASELAAVIVEPVQRVIAPEPGFLETVRDVTRQCGVLLLFDEIVTGFRLAYGGAQQFYNVTPDLTILGKAVGGGYPIGIIGGRKDIMDLVGDGTHPGSIHYSGTLNGNPISTSAGLAALAVLRAPGTYERLHEMGDYMRAGLNRLFQKHGVQAQAVGVGPWYQILFTTGPVRNYADYLRHDKRRARALGLRVLREGVLVNPASKSYLSLAHTRTELDHVLAVYDHALSDPIAGD